MNDSTSLVGPATSTYGSPSNLSTGSKTGRYVYFSLGTSRRLRERPRVC